MRRQISIVLAVLLPVLLLVSVYLEVWILPRAIDLTTTRFPETKPLAVPGLVWAIVATACCQAIVIIALRLVALARSDNFEDYAFSWLRAIVGCLITFTVLVAWAFTTLAVLGYGSPAMAELVVLGVIALIATVALLASRAIRRPRRSVEFGLAYPRLSTASTTAPERGAPRGQSAVPPADAREAPESTRGRR